MKLAIIIILLIYRISFLHAIDTLWTQMFGEYNRDVRGYSIQQTFDGGLIIAGINRGFFPYDPCRFSPKLTP